MFYVVDDGLFAAGDANGRKLDEFKQGDSIGEEALLAKVRARLPRRPRATDRTCRSRVGARDARGAAARRTPRRRITLRCAHALAPRAQSLRPYTVVSLSKGRLWAMDRLKYHQVRAPRGARARQAATRAHVAGAAHRAGGGEQQQRAERADHQLAAERAAAAAALQAAAERAAGGVQKGGRRPACALGGRGAAHQLRDRLPPSSRQVTYPPGATIIREGERGDTFFIIQRGAVMCRCGSSRRGPQPAAAQPGWSRVHAGTTLTRRASACATSGPGSSSARARC